MKTTVITLLARCYHCGRPIHGCAYVPGEIVAHRICTPRKD